MHARTGAVLAGLAIGIATAAPAQVVLDGYVRDDVTGGRVPGAQVLLLDRHNRTVGYRVTDDSGYFTFSRSQGGWFSFDVKAIGYQRVVTPVLRWMTDHAYAQLEVRLAPNVALLAPLEVVALSPALASPVLENMMHRRTQGFAVEITRDDIEKRRPVSVTDMLIEIPGVYAARRGTGASGRVLYMGRALGGTGCPVQIFLDGMLATRAAPGGDVTVDDIVTPLDVEGIEVFRGLGSVPPEFLTPDSRCGVIAIWTKRAH